MCAKEEMELDAAIDTYLLNVCAKEEMELDAAIETHICLMCVLKKRWNWMQL